MRGRLLRRLRQRRQAVHRYHATMLRGEWGLHRRMVRRLYPSREFDERSRVLQWRRSLLRHRLHERRLPVRREPSLRRR
jgi:hypothetical protein